MRQVQGFEIGEVLRGAFAVYARNWLAFALLALITFAPLCVLFALDPRILGDPAFPLPPEDAKDVAAQRAYVAEFFAAIKSMTVALGSYMAVYTFCSAWLYAGLAYAVIRDLRATAPPFPQVLGQSFRALPCALVASVLANLCMVVGFMLLVVPGIIALLVLWVAVPAAVVERRYASALRRSAALTKGYKGQLFGLLVLIVFFGLLSNALADALTSQAGPLVHALVRGVVEAANTSIATVIIAVSYHDLRVIKDKEGAGVSVAKVFE